MNSHAPLFEETGDDSADQLVAKLNQACDMLLNQNSKLRSTVASLEAELTALRQSESTTKQRIESLIQRLKLLEQEA